VEYHTKMLACFLLSKLGRLLILSLRMWSVFFMLWLVEITMAKCVNSKQVAYE
jgi:hypothetical protein